MTNEELVERIRAGENVQENMTALYDQTRGFIHSLVWKYRAIHGREQFFASSDWEAGTDTAV